MKPVKGTTDVLGLLLDPGVQKELVRVNPRFNRADLLDTILEHWPNGQVGFAKSIIQEFLAAAPGSLTRKDIIRLVSNLISEESAAVETRPVTELTDDELAATVKSILPTLEGLRDDQG